MASKVNNKPLKFGRLAGRPYSVYTKDSYGPTFGGGHDFHISDDAKSNSNSFIVPGNTYKAPPGQQAGIFLAGTSHFVPSEVETFYLLKIK